jgi:murein DD-endopeptidase MepM/ murein hydrolase activator NlpD
MIKKSLLFCLSFAAAVLYFSCSQINSPISANQDEKIATVGVYNSFPWNWHLPYVGSAYVTQGYGGDCWDDTNSNPTHVGSMYYAVDFSGGGAASGEPVKACAAGYVQFAGWDNGANSGFGNQVVVEAGPTGQAYPNQDNRYLYRVAHMSSVLVTAGWWVERGQTLGYVGSTGYSTGAHIHFEVKRGSYAGYGGISGESFPPDFSDGVDGYAGSCNYWQISGQ